VSKERSEREINGRWTLWLLDGEPRFTWAGNRRGYNIYSARLLSGMGRGSSLKNQKTEKEVRTTTVKKYSARRLMNNAR